VCAFQSREGEIALDKSRVVEVALVDEEGRPLNEAVWFVLLPGDLLLGPLGSREEAGRVLVGWSSYLHLAFILKGNWDISTTACRLEIFGSDARFAVWGLSVGEGVELKFVTLPDAPIMLLVLEMEHARDHLTRTARLRAHVMRKTSLSPEVPTRGKG